METNTESSVKQRKGFSAAAWLMALCWLVYTCSYIGKLSYNANINQIEKAFGVSYQQAGTVSTFFFFAYGIGQVLNGLLCKKYNIRFVVALGLFLSCAMNVLAVSVKAFAFLKWFWLVNGAATSFLWTSLIRLLSETLGGKEIKKAVVVMGTTVATGTFLVYGMSAVFAAVGAFRVSFYIAAAILFVVAFVWIFSYKKLVDPLKALRVEERVETVKTEETKSANGGKGLLFFFVVFALFAVGNNFVKDGLTVWTPDMLDSIYDTPGWLSILLTLLLPTLAVFGTAVATALHSKIKNFALLCSTLFLTSTALIGIVVGFLSVSLVLTVAIFALISCLMAGINNVITSMVPLYMKDKVNSGMVAGVLNGFCYLGSTVSSYGLGSIADGFGWLAVFYVLLTVCGVITLIGLLYFGVEALKKRKKKN